MLSDLRKRSRAIGSINKAKRSSSGKQSGRITVNRRLLQKMGLGEGVKVMMKWYVQMLCQVERLIIDTNVLNVTCAKRFLCIISFHSYSYPSIRCYYFSFLDDNTGLKCSSHSCIHSLFTCSLIHNSVNKY